MSEAHNNEDVPATLRVLLNEESEKVSPEVAQGLARARQAALDEARAQEDRRSAAWLPPGQWMAAAVAVTAAVTLVVGISFTSNERVPEIPLTSVSELAVAEDLDLLEQLEFIAWLEEEERGAG